MQLSYVKKLDFHIQKTNVCILKINGIRLQNFDMIIIFFLIDNKDKKT